MQITTGRLQELRHLLQHELAYRNLVLACAQHNAMLLDPAMRAKEISDVILVGPSRELCMNDHGATLMRRLRQSGSLAGAKSEPKAKPAKAKGTESQIVQDSSRYMHLLQTPATHLKPIRDACTSIYEDRLAQTKNAGGSVSELDRQLRLLSYKMLTAISLVVARCACDLSVRVQASQAALTFRG